jgi:hypothetical protein
VVSCWIYAGWVVSPGGGPALIGSNECIADRSSARCEREERAPRFGSSQPYLGPRGAGAAPATRWIQMTVARSCLHTLLVRGRA